MIVQNVQTDNAISVGDQVTDTANTAVRCCLTFSIWGNDTFQRSVEIKMDSCEFYPQMP